MWGGYLLWGFGWTVLATAASAPRAVQDLDGPWRFHLGEVAAAMHPAYDDGAWEGVRVPHDWSIAGPFGPEHASGTGYAAGGIGWYRRHFCVPEAWRDRRVAVVFDGVYCNSEVWINGRWLGRRPYGYIGFRYDLTRSLRFGGADNVLAVRVDHSREADSRWYTGSGIYRHVRLVATGPLRIAPEGTFVTTPSVVAERAVLRVATELENLTETPRAVALCLDLRDPNGRAVARAEVAADLEPETRKTVSVRLSVAKPRRWSVTDPALYTLDSTLRAQGRVADVTETVCGLRSFRFDPDHGFFLNGRNLILKGLCLHHDAGCLGAAVPAGVWRRRLETLRELGCNAIRASHNPPAPELLDLCDRLGFLVMDEAFDEFSPPKNKWVAGWNQGVPARAGYGEWFPAWSVRDIEALVRRDRNHPAVILWSIGNEVDYANDPFSHPVLGEAYRPDQPPATDLVRWGRPLVAAVKALDPTRPVTAALANVPMSDAVGFTDLLDVVGYNYQEKRYAEHRRRYPRRVIYGSENGDSHRAWLAVRDDPAISGQFLWTGIDYLGEAGAWPNRAAGAGLLDLAGFKKPGAWWRQSLWSDTPMVYLCARPRHEGRSAGVLRSHWNWPAGTEMELLCCTNCPEVRLQINDGSPVTLRRDAATSGWLRWALPYEAGRVVATGLREGQAVCSVQLQTAGPIRGLRLEADRTSLPADGRAVCHVTVTAVDAANRRVPDATDLFEVTIAGPARLLGIENGQRDGAVDYQDPRHALRRGRALVILQSESAPGPIVLRVRAAGLPEAELRLTAE